MVLVAATDSVDGILGANASSGIALGLKGYMPVAAKPLIILADVIAVDHAFLNIPGHVCFVMVCCKLSDMNSLQSELYIFFSGPNMDLSHGCKSCVQ